MRPSSNGLFGHGAAVSPQMEDDYVINVLQITTNQWDCLGHVIECCSLVTPNRNQRKTVNMHYSRIVTTPNELPPY